MRGLSTFTQIYVCTKVVDFRKGMNGLSEVIEGELRLEPFSGALFLFMHRRRDRVKVLYWDSTGYALWSKRLEKDKFPWPRKGFDKSVLSLSPEQLDWLLSGIDIWKVRRHESLRYEATG